MYNYPLPSFLEGIRTQADYSSWVGLKASHLRDHDIKVNRPFSAIPTHEEYGREVNRAVVAGNGIDPFIHDKLRYDLVDSYDDCRAKGDIAYDRQFDLMPVADHIDPAAAVLCLEITAKRTNACKSGQTPGEFIAMCRTIAAHGWMRTQMQARTQGRSRARLLQIPFFKHFQVYFPPDFTKGKCTGRQYRKWLINHTRNLYYSDVNLKRPYALNSSWGSYCHMMNDAAQLGRFDPYTGEELAWEEIGAWDSHCASDNLEYFNKFRLLPTVDHIDPAADVLEFEICSWKINLCKGNLNPQEFVELCKRVVLFAA